MFIMDEDKFWSRINLEDIYYIETIKSTHYCEVQTKNGSGKLHGDIIALQRQLPEYFYKTRASTLANMKLVQRIDTKSRLMYFKDDICCSYTGKRSKEIKSMLKLQNYRNYKRERNGKDADTAI